MPILFDCNSQVVFKQVLSYVKEVPNAEIITLDQLKKASNKPEFANLFIRDASLFHQPASQADEILYKQSMDVINNMNIATFQKDEAEFLEQIRKATFLDSYKEQ